MTNKNCDISDNGIRFIGSDFTYDGQKKYFCKAFAAKCAHFRDTGLCDMGDCVHAEPNIPSSDEMLRLQLLQMRLDQLNMMRVRKRKIYKSKTK